MITLPAPVFVQPGFQYEIQLHPEQCTDEHFYEFGNVMPTVKIGNDLIIEFGGDHRTCNGLGNVIVGLGFNKTIKFEQTTPKSNNFSSKLFEIAKSFLSFFNKVKN